jgi:uridine phosphorylase
MAKPWGSSGVRSVFACGCCFLISMTSAGQIALDGAPPYFMVIARALRDEGTSYHYSPPSSFAEADPQLVALAFDAMNGRGLNPIIGTTWTTDAPFRETAAAIDAARKQGIRAVEMEAAALYAFAHDRSAAVLCLAHVTNTMGQNEQDFEKGELDGAASALAILEAIVKAVRAASSPMRTG